MKTKAYYYLILIFVLIITNLCFSQEKKTYAYYVNAGYSVYPREDSFIKKELYRECINKMPERLPGDTSYYERYEVYYNLALCYTKLGEIDSAFYYLRQFVLINPYKNDFVYVHLGFDTLHTYKSRWDAITDTIEKEYLQRDSITQNQALAVELFRMGIYDQQYRGMSYVSVKGTKFNWGLQAKIDKQNMKKLRKIVKQHGWPTISKVGVAASMNAFLILQHDFPIRKKYYKIYSEAFRQKDVLSGSYAMLTDRYLLQHKKKQLYGTQSVRHLINGKWEEQTTLSPVEDFKNINQRRKEMGYSTTIEEYCKENNIRIPEEYYNE